MHHNLLHMLMQAGPHTAMQFIIPQIWSEFTSLFQTSAKVYGKEGQEERDSFLTRAKFQMRVSSVELVQHS